MKAGKRARARSPKAVGPAIAAQPKRGTGVATATSRCADTPKLIDAMVAVMGNKLLSREEVFAQLNDRGWAPGASEPLSYLQFTMTSLPDLFERVGAKFRVRIRGSKAASAAKAHLGAPVTPVGGAGPHPEFPAAGVYVRMAKSNQKPPVQFTHKDLITLLNEVWSLQFIHLARFDLRQSVDSFFLEAVKLGAPTDPLGSLVPHFPALKDALKQHQADIADGKVNLGLVKPTPPSWYAAFKEYGPNLLNTLRRPALPIPEGTSAGDAAPPLGAAVGPSAGLAAAGAPPAPAAVSDSTGSSSLGDAEASPVLPALTEPARAAGGAVPSEGGVSSQSTWEMPPRLAEAAGPAFPCEALSPWLKQFVEQLSDQTQVPIDVPAVWTLAAFGAAAAKGVFVEVQRGDRHPTNLWTMTVMPSGGGKSPTLECIRAPFDEKQVELRAAARDIRARRETELRVTRRRLHSLEAQAASADDPDEREDLLEQCAAMQTAIFGLERTTVPTLTTGDPTQASLTQLMDENDGKIVLFTDEGDQLFARIGGGEGIEAMLQAHSGATIEKTRAGRHEIRVVEPSLSLVMGIQPGPFARAMANRVYHDKGFLARFLFTVLEVKTGTRKQERSGLDELTRHDYRNRIRRLLELSSKRAVTLTLAPEAFAAFSAFAARVDRDLAGGGLSELREWGNKLRSVAARLAGVLHAADHALGGAIPGEISLQTMERALRIAAYFEEHAFVAYGDAIRSAEDEAAKKVWRWIADARLSGFRHGEAVRALNGRLAAVEVAEALDRLVDDGYLRLLSTPRAVRGRPSKASFRVNPLLVKPTEETEGTQGAY